MNLEGELQTVALPAILESLAAVRSSGILTVQGEDDIVAVSFLDGAIVAADALNQTVEEGLGKALREGQMISTEDFEAVANEHQGGGSGSLGEILVQRGLITRDELLVGLRRQTYQLMLQVLSWQRGEFKFYGGDEVSHEEGFRPLSVDELLVRSIEELGSFAGSAAELPAVDRVYRRTSGQAPVRVLGRDGDGLGPGVWLRPEQADFLARIDDDEPASAPARAGGLSEHQGRYTLFKLLRHGLIAAVDHTEPVAARPGARPPGTAWPAAPQPVPAAPSLLGPHLRDPSGTKPGIATSVEEAGSLRAEIFTPPEPALIPEEEPAVQMPAPAASTATAATWLGPALSLVLIVTLAWNLARGPEPTGLGKALLPFSWQADQRGALSRQVRQSLYLKIDRAAKVYFLVEAHYPDSLSDLVELGLLSQADLDDPAGYHLAYTTDEVGYRIDVSTLDGSVEDLGTTESITGDFLLDPQWSQLAASDSAPLVLLD